MAEHANDLVDRFYGLRRESLQELAFKLAERKEIARPFNNNKAESMDTGVRGTQHRNIPGKMCILYIYEFIFLRHVVGY
jgi:hypothetical protein